MSKTVQMLKNYVPYNEQEKTDIEQIIEAEEKLGQILTRDNRFCHLCGSAFVINKSHDKVLAIYHNIFDSWTFPGGHADGDDDMLYVAKKELEEETSLKSFKLLSEDPIAVDSIDIAAHFKRGKFVSAHLHMNVTYLFEADEQQTLQIKADENQNVGWLGLDELVEKSTEPHMVVIFKKIIERIRTNKF